MNKEYSLENSGFNQHACYLIKIQARLDLSWANQFYGMSIDVLESENNEYMSVLTGCLPDQAALAGE